MRFTPLSLALAALMPASPVLAQEVGRVISSTPIIQQVAVPRQVCTQQQVTVQKNKSGAGAAMGAIAGGTFGHALGRDSALGRAIGMFGGAILGEKIEGPANPEVRHVQNCTQQTVYENRTMAYNVVYEFAGKQYSVQMPSDPGPTVRLQITPMPNPPATTFNVPPPGSAPRF